MRLNEGNSTLPVGELAAGGGFATKAPISSLTFSNVAAVNVAAVNEHVAKPAMPARSDSLGRKTTRSRVVGLALVVPLHEPKFASGLNFLRSVSDYPHRPMWFAPVFESLVQQRSFESLLNGTDAMLPWLLPIVATVDVRDIAASKKLIGLMHVFTMRGDVTHAIALDAESRIQTRQHYAPMVNAWSAQRKIVLWRPTAFNLETCHDGVYFMKQLDACTSVGLPTIPGYAWWADAPIFERKDFFDFLRRIRWPITFVRPPFLEHAAYMCYKHHVHGWDLLNSTLWFENSQCHNQDQLKGYAFVWSRDTCRDRLLQFHLDRRLPRSKYLRFGPLACQKG